MTQRSRFWEGTLTGDAVEAPYDSYTEFAKVMQSLAGADADSNRGAVMANVLNELAVSGTASPISIATGRAFVDGTWYENDAITQIAVAAGAVTLYGYVVLQKDFVAQTVRLVIPTPVAAAPTPLVQNAGVLWEYPLASFSITAGGAITVTDLRTFSARRTMQMIASYTMVDDTLDEFNFTNIPQGFKHLMIQVYGKSDDASLDAINVYLNGVTGGTDYSYVGSTQVLAAAGPTSTLTVQDGAGAAYGIIGWVPGAGVGARAADMFGPTTIWIPNYRSTHLAASHSVGGLIYEEDDTNSRMYNNQNFTMGPAGPVTRVTLKILFGFWKAGSMATLYGLP